MACECLCHESPPVHLYQILYSQLPKAFSFQPLQFLSPISAAMGTLGIALSGGSWPLVQDFPLPCCQVLGSGLVLIKRRKKNV